MSVGRRRRRFCKQPRREPPAAPQPPSDTLMVRQHSKACQYLAALPNALKLGPVARLTVGEGGGESRPLAEGGTSRGAEWRCTIAPAVPASGHYRPACYQGRSKVLQFSWFMGGGRLFGCFLWRWAWQRAAPGQYAPPPPPQPLPKTAIRPAWLRDLPVWASFGRAAGGSAEKHGEFYQPRLPLSYVSNRG